MSGCPAQAPSSPMEPRLLVTFTIRPAGERRSSGRNALITRTTEHVGLVDEPQIVGGLLGRRGDLVDVPAAAGADPGVVHQDVATKSDVADLSGRLHRIEK